ncbi:MAG: hypothetical protein AAGJ82_05700, partial [Bacteroidota bacterium]
NLRRFMSEFIDLVSAQPRARRDDFYSRFLIYRIGDASLSSPGQTHQNALPLFFSQVPFDASNILSFRL